MEKVNQRYSSTLIRWLSTILIAVVAVIAVFVVNPNKVAAQSGPSDYSIAYGRYSPENTVDVIGSILDLNTPETAVEFTTPANGFLYIEDMNHAEASWSANNTNLAVTKDPVDLGYKVSGLTTIPSGTIVMLTAHYRDNSTNSFYFKIEQSVSQVVAASYGFYNSEGLVDGFTSIKPNTSQTAIPLKSPNTGEFYLEDVNDFNGTWSADNTKLQVTKDPRFEGYKVSGLNSLAANTVVKFTIQHSYGSTSDFYFKVEPTTPTHDANVGYGFYGADGSIGGLTNIDPNTNQTPILLTAPNDGRIYLEDMNDSKTTWTSDNSKLSIVKDPRRDGFQISKLTSLTSGTVVKFTAHHSNGQTNDFYFKVTVNSTPGGGSTGGGTGSGTSPNPVTPPANTTPTPGSPTSPVTPPNNPTTPTSPTTTNPETTPSTTGNVTAKGGVVYAVKKLVCTRVPISKSHSELLGTLSRNGLTAQCLSSPVMLVQLMALLDTKFVMSTMVAKLLVRRATLLLVEIMWHPFIMQHYPRIKK